ncbi:TniB family NTP-binding protein [uncultured Sphingomonas sp.]|uniref:TniB family NTP-binding protein n=1 Tax=uncultured Sphingomonas sp. TaxID=158754 RepID=UPI0037495079
MKLIKAAPDPLGVAPQPLTGDLQPRFLDEAMRTASEKALAACEAVWVEHHEQEVVIAQIRSYLGTWALAEDKHSCGGRRLSQYSQAGKSAAMKRLRRVLAQIRREQGLEPNDYQVVIITLRKRLSLKQLYRLILKNLGDPHYEQERVGPDTLLKRIEEHSRLLGVELLVIDEVQHLDNASRDATEVLDQLKVFVDEALFPIVFVGDEDSVGFFERNQKFAARLGTPLELRPMEPLRDDDLGQSDALAFRQFCDRFDRALRKSRAISKRAGLKNPHLLDGLILSSKGHVGRVARILQVAVAHSVWRGAETIEAYDLSHAVRTYAMKNKWILEDPYSRHA